MALFIDTSALVEAVRSVVPHAVIDQTSARVAPLIRFRRGLFDTEIDEDGHLLQRIVVDPPEKLGLHNPIGACYLLRRMVHEELGGYRDDVFLAEDLDFWIRMLIKFQIAPLHEDLYLYRKHPDSLTTTNRRVYKVHGEVLQKYLAQMYWMNDDQKSHAYFRQANRALWARDMRSAAGYLLQAFRLSPTFFIRHSLRKAQEPFMREAHQA